MLRPEHECQDSDRRILVGGGDGVHTNLEVCAKADEPQARAIATNKKDFMFQRTAARVN